MKSNEILLSHNGKNLDCVLLDWHHANSCGIEEPIVMEVPH